MKENEISYLIRGVIYKVFNKLGPGLFENVYEEIVFYELTKLGLYVQRQVPLPVIWEEVKLEHGYRVDLLVEKKVIIEVKSIENINPIHYKQLSTYVVLSGVKLGILVNFNEKEIDNGIKRFVNRL